MIKRPHAGGETIVQIAPLSWHRCRDNQTTNKNAYGKTRLNRINGQLSCMHYCKDKMPENIT